MLNMKTKKKISEGTKAIVASIIFLIGIVTFAIAQPSPQGDGNDRQNTQVDISVNDSVALFLMGIENFTYTDSYCQENGCYGIMRANTGLEISYSYPNRKFVNRRWIPLSDEERLVAFQNEVGERIHQLAVKFTRENNRTYGREGEIGLT